LHDTFEDTELVHIKQDIEKVFGPVVYNGVYILSNNTVGKHAEAFDPLFQVLGVHFRDGDKISPEAYKLRILFSRDTIKRVKIADMITNTESLPE
jgi:hypothetical protein